MNRFFQKLNLFFSFCRSRNSSRLAEQANITPEQLFHDCVRWSQAGNGGKDEILKIEISKDKRISGITSGILLEILGHKGGRNKLEDRGLRIIKEGPSELKKEMLIISNSTFYQNLPEDVASAVHTLQNQLR